MPDRDQTHLARVDDRSGEEAGAEGDQGQVRQSRHVGLCWDEAGHHVGQPSQQEDGAGRKQDPSVVPHPQ